MTEQSEEESDKHAKEVVHGSYDPETGEIIINKEASTDAGSD